MPNLLRRGNAKLGGSDIWTFTLPALATCPGATPLCEQHCYALRGFFNMPSTLKALADNRKAAARADFPRRIIAEITVNRIEVVRGHVGGDFGSAGYVRKWRRIAAACQTTRMYFYSRSWSIPDIRRELVKLSRHQNVFLWWSLDRDTGMPAHVPSRVRLAYLSEAVDDPPPAGVDLVFRTNASTVQKYLNGALVCPEENGATPNVTCEVCRLCFTDREIPSRPPEVGRLALPVVQT